eukprot:COSAG01_NODE_2430_length_7711_cov_182.453100_4_plen_66_part_00
MLNVLRWRMIEPLRNPTSTAVIYALGNLMQGAYSCTTYAGLIVCELCKLSLKGALAGFASINCAG